VASGIYISENKIEQQFHIATDDILFTLL